MTCGIYQIKNTVTGKVYIGSSWNIEQRWRSHRHELRYGKHHSPHLQSAWNKYGPDKFSFLILEECSRDDVVNREQFHMDLFKSYDREYGYNARSIAYGNYDNFFSKTEEFCNYISRLVKKRYESDEERRKTGEATKLGQSHPQVRERQRKSGLRRWAKDGEREAQCKRMKEYCNTEEHRKILSEGQKARFADPDQRKRQLLDNPLRKRVLCVETGQIFDSINEAAKILTVSIVTIRDNANGKRKSKRYNFQWVKNE